MNKVVHLTQSEYESLVQARRDRDRMLVRAGAGSLHARAEALIIAARLTGHVVSIEAKPRTPLAMGHYESIVTLTPSHGNYRGEPT